MAIIAKIKMILNHGLGFSFLVLCMLVFDYSPVFALEDNTALQNDQELLFQDTAGALRCPSCTGLSVLESDADFSVQIKNIVRQQVREGKNKDDILRYFVERYGPWILRVPPASGFNIVLWVFPIFLLSLCPLMVWFYVSQKKETSYINKSRSVESILSEIESELSALRNSGDRHV